MEGLNKAIVIKLNANNSSDRIVVNSLNDELSPNGNNTVKSIALTN